VQVSGCCIVDVDEPSAGETWGVC